jgi:hypothetical protein
MNCRSHGTSAKEEWEKSLRPRETTSRLLMRLELGIIIFPSSLILIGSSLLLLEVVSRRPTTYLLLALPVALLLLPLVAGARLAIGFSAKGAIHLRSLSMVWWFLATMGAGIPLLGLAAQLITWSAGGTIHEIAASYLSATPIDDPLGLRLSTAIAILCARSALVGLPLLIPLVHLWLERARVEAAGSSGEPIQL